MTREQLLQLMFAQADAERTGYMSWLTFIENRPAILAGLRLLTADARARRRFRALEVHERPSGELLMEVFTTAHGPVAVWRGGGGEGDFVRQDRGGDDLAVAPLDGDPGTRFTIVSARTHYVFTQADIRRWIIDGHGRHTVRAPDFCESE